MTASIPPLEPFQLRTIWPNEAKDFTPWMGQPEPLARLGRALGLGPLELIAREHSVGDFWADVLARDPWGGPVVIENQLEPTDHTHLGQAITYVAGIPDGATVIWIASRIRPEHAEALRWLNAQTPTSIGFYGVEIGLWTVGGSSPGYDFRVVVKPDAHKLSGQDKSGSPLTAEGAALQGYWMAFRDFLTARGAEHWMRSELPKSGWWGRNLGRPGFNLYAIAKPAAQALSVVLEISSADHTDAFAKLNTDRAAIDAEIGGAPQWSSTEARDYISVERKDANLAEPTGWPEQHAWLLDQLECFRRVFRDRIAGLALEPSERDERGNSP